MQETTGVAPSLLSVPALKRRTLLGGLAVVLVVAVAAFVFMHRAGAAQPKHKHHPRPVHPALGPCPKGHVKSHGRCSLSTKPKVKRRVVRHHPRVYYTPIQTYAVGLQPILDHDRRLFDNATRDLAASGGLDGMNSACSYYLPRLQLAENSADGVPHPLPWYTRVGTLHRQLLDVYHRAEGALNLCVTAVSTGDTGAGANAVSDMQTADWNLRHFDDYAHWQSTHR